MDPAAAAQSGVSLIRMCRRCLDEAAATAAEHGTDLPNPITRYEE